jgi:uncharacterized membrane protein YqhA
MRSLINGTRYLVLIAVFGLLFAALAVFIFGGITTVVTVIESFQLAEFNADGARLFSVELIELIDLFLLGTVLYITAVGLHELFIDPTMEEVLPTWLSVSSLDELKFNLLAVIVVMLAVLFLGEVASGSLEAMGLFGFGTSIALVIIALGLAVYTFAKVHHMHGEHEAVEVQE